LVAAPFGAVLVAGEDQIPSKESLPDRSNYLPLRASSVGRVGFINATAMVDVAAMLRFTVNPFNGNLQSVALAIGEE